MGASPVSTGKPGRLQHFKTPVGVLLNDGSEIGYRAQGTFNQNHIRGLGVKGMRVWDFGWHTTDDWRTPGATMAVRVEMHATDPDCAGSSGSAGPTLRAASACRMRSTVSSIATGSSTPRSSGWAKTDSGYRALLSPELDLDAARGRRGDRGGQFGALDRNHIPPETSIALSD